MCSQQVKACLVAGDYKGMATRYVMLSVTAFVVEFMREGMKSICNSILHAVT